MFIIDKNSKFDIKSFRVINDQSPKAINTVANIASNGFSITGLSCKEWELEKETKVNQDFLLIKSSGILFIFLPAFYLIIWPMTHQSNF